MLRKEDQIYLLKRLLRHRTQILVGKRAAMLFPSGTATDPTNHRHPTVNKNEEGYILIMTIIIMAILGIIATSLLGGTSVQRDLSSNYAQKESALQNADNALNYAESWVVQNPMPSATPCNGTSSKASVCISTDFNPDTLLEPTSDSTAEGTLYEPSDIQTSGAGFTYQYPRFYIQDEGFTYNGSTITGSLFKITSAAYGDSSDSIAVVQALYSVQAGSTGSPNTGQQITWIQLR